MLPEYVKFYYDRLSLDKKDVYLQFYEAFKQRKKIVEITAASAIQLKDIDYIMRSLYYDTPSFYYLNVTEYAYKKTFTGYIIYVEYLYTNEQIDKFDQQLLDGLIKFKKQYIRDDMSEYEKELAIHDYLIRTVEYDSESIKAKDGRHKEIYNVLGVLLRRKAVCMGISCAFKLICDFLRIKCFAVRGKTVWAKETDPGHAWNMVKLDGETYHVDVTWDLRSKRKDMRCCYDYLNLPDHLIRFNHTWSDDIYPECTALTYNYYYRYKFFVRSLDKIADFILHQYEQGRRYIAFKYANDMPPDEDIDAEIERGVRLTQYVGCYRFVIEREIHNIYIEMD